jgi:hypothetical protein
MTNATANLSFHLSSGWLSGTVGMATIARRTRVGDAARSLLQPGAYQLLRAANEQEARGIIAILRGGERAIIVEGSRNAGAFRAIIIEGSRSGARGIIIEGGRNLGAQRGFIVEGRRGGQRGIIVEGSRSGNADRAIIIEGGLEWLNALESGTLHVMG